MFRSVILILVGSFCNAADRVPNFKDYSIGTLYRGPVAKVILSSEFQRRFRTQILRASKQPPNFAGVYRVAEWGCGSSCVSIAVINLKTGVVRDGPFAVLGYGAPHHYEGGEYELDYRTSSRLLVARGCPEDKNCGTYYYEWIGDGFRLLRSVPAK